MPKCKKHARLPCSNFDCTKSACKDHSHILCLDCIPLLNDNSLQLERKVPERTTCASLNCNNRTQVFCENKSCHRPACTIHRGRLCTECVSHIVTTPLRSNPSQSLSVGPSQVTGNFEIIELTEWKPLSVLLNRKNL